MSENKMRWVYRAAAGLGIVIALAALVFKIFQPIQVLPRIRLAPGFSMIGQDGKRLTNEDLRGKFVLYNFMFTRCEPPCKQMVTIMQDVQRRLNEVELGGIPVQLITVNLDPKVDTPAAMSSYAEAVGADPKIWRFATSPDEKLLKYIVGGGFEVYYKPEADGSITFDPSLVLVDGWGIIRGEYKYATQTPQADRILRHLGVLAKEVRESQGVASVAYEAAHLFLCYSP